MKTNELLGLFCVVVSTIAAMIAAINGAISAKLSKKSLDTSLELFKKEKEEKLVDKLNKILEIAIQYPYMESRPFTSKWVQFKDSEDERYLRYDMYCNLIFNYIEDVYTFFDHDKKKIEDFIDDIKFWIRLHKYNWQNPVIESENIDAYKEDFRSFIK